MKHCLSFLAALFVLVNANAQTAQRPLNISIGGGTQAYNGDLGNTWFERGEETYGIGGFNFGRYLNRSFDANVSVITGNFGHCRMAGESKYRTDGTEVLNMLSELTSVVVSGKYKFANGYILKENARLAPYVYAGVGYNNVTNRFWKDKTRVNPGNYGSLNGGWGLRLNFCEKFNLTYNMGFGYFTSDKMDFRSAGSNDKVMQNTLMGGMNF